LFADGLQPETERRRIRVDERFHTSIPGVYAIGDVSSPVQLAHVAAAQGIACVDGICGNKPSVDLSIIPACIYTRPEIACVGLTDAEAKEQNIPVKIGKCVMGANARTMIADPGRSFMKITAHAETGKVLGAVLMCPNATDMISEISSAIANGLTVKQLLRSMRPHPTFSEALTDALSDAERKRNQ
jgi:dihydrolipoamide dehydrogenase